MTGVLPVLSSSVQAYEDVASRDLLATLGNGHLSLETASSKRVRNAVKFHTQDIQECFHKVLRLFDNPTVTDLENSLDETQDELEEEIIRQDEEIRRKDEELIRLRRLLGQGTN